MIVIVRGWQLDMEGSGHILRDDHLIMLLEGNVHWQSSLKVVSLVDCIHLTEKSVALLADCAQLRTLGIRRRTAWGGHISTLLTFFLFVLRLRDRLLPRSIRQFRS